jgi:ubiquinone/menaquinone biosynthesis C-methylase UbiE
MKNNKTEIEKNIKAHNKIAKKYKKLHTEIYNKTEQERLKEKLIYAKSLIKTVNQNEEKYKALDYGCGDGNLTKHLLDIDFTVTSADISVGFLNLIENNFQEAKTLLLNGEDLKEIKSDSFDFICTYSVLHHIPDYLKAITEMKRVLKPGGVIFLEHESSPDYWTNTSILFKFYKESTKNKKVFLFTKLLS